MSHHAVAMPYSGVSSGRTLLTADCAPPADPAVRPVPRDRHTRSITPLLALQSITSRLISPNL